MTSTTTTGASIPVQLSKSCSARLTSASDKTALTYRPSFTSDGKRTLDCYDMKAMEQYYAWNADSYGRYPGVIQSRVPVDVMQEYVKWSRTTSSGEEALEQIRTEMQLKANKLRKPAKEDQSIDSVVPGDNSNTWNISSALVMLDEDEMAHRDPQQTEKKLSRFIRIRPFAGALFWNTMNVSEQQNAMEPFVDLKAAHMNSWYWKGKISMGQPFGTLEHLELATTHSQALSKNLVSCPPITLARLEADGITVGFDRLHDVDMFYVAFDHIMMIDIGPDQIGGQNTSDDSVRRRLQTNWCPILDALLDSQMMALSKDGTSIETGDAMQWSIYRTDNGGVRAFCTSHIHYANSFLSLQLMCLLRGDFENVARVPVYGAWFVGAGPKRLCFQHEAGNYEFLTDRFIGNIEMQDSTKLYHMTDASAIPAKCEQVEFLYSVMTGISTLLHDTADHLSIGQSASYDIICNLLKAGDVPTRAAIQKLIINASQAVFGASVTNRSSNNRVRLIDATPMQHENENEKDNKSLSSTSSNAVHLLIASSFQTNLESRKQTFLHDVISQQASDVRSWWELFLHNHDGAHMYVQMVRLLPLLYGHTASSRYKMTTAILEQQFNAWHISKRLGYKNHTFANEKHPIDWVKSDTYYGNTEASMTFVLPMQTIVQKVVQTLEDDKPVVIPLAYFLKFEGQGIHINAVLINVHDRVVEHFESHGDTQDGRSRLVSDFVLALNRALKNKNGTDALQFKEVTPGEITLHAVQRGRFNSMCMAYSLLYFHLRFLFPEVPATSVVQWIIGAGGAGIGSNDDELQMKFIQNYIAYVHQLVHDNENRLDKDEERKETSPQHVELASSFLDSSAAPSLSAPGPSSRQPLYNTSLAQYHLNQERNIRKHRPGYDAVLGNENTSLNNLYGTNQE